jgi:hypothetical protein
VKVVEVLGKEKAIEIFRETRKIEEDGGMMVLVCSLHYFVLRVLFSVYSNAIY